MIIAAALLCGCSSEHEIDRPGTWRPTGANEANLRAMLADPRDLSSGIGSTTERGSGAARAVTRVLTDRRRPLLDVTTSKIAPPSSGGDAAPALPSGPSGGGGAQ